MILLAILAWLFVTSPLYAATYYIDITAGDDTNNGTAKATPWKHVPGMKTCANTCASTTPTAGDTFVLKGGETWPTGSFPIAWRWSGSSGNVITIGVDATWYTGGAWSRPIWDMEDTPATDTHAGNTNTAFWYCRFADVSACSYVTITNIEMTRFSWTGAPAYGFCAQIQGYGVTNLILDQLYIHDWSHSGATVDCMAFLGQTSTPYGVGNTIQNSIIDGSRVGDSGGLWFGPPNILSNEVSYVSQGFLPVGGASILGNTLHHCVESFEVGMHENFIETLDGPASNYNVYIANNYVYGTGSGNSCETLYVGYQYETAYVWNNVFADMSGNPMTYNGSSVGVEGYKLYVWNNTFYVNKDGLSSYYCLTNGRPDTDPLVEIDARNNHCITSQAQFDAPATGDHAAVIATTLTLTPNTLQTIGAANGQGYTTNQTYKYSPTDSGDMTIGAGDDLTAKCVGALASLCFDTTYGAVRSGNVIIGAGRTANPRPNGSAWDVGAYQFVALPRISGSIAVTGGVSIQ